MLFPRRPRPTITDLEYIGRQGVIFKDDNLRFRGWLNTQSPNMIDTMVMGLHHVVTRDIDCTQCGNCCKAGGPAVTKKEIRRLAKHESMSAEAYEAANVSRDRNGTCHLKQTPCKYFLGGYCAVYTKRPDECRKFPHTDLRDFTTRLYGMIDRYSWCPIVYNIMERLKDETGYRRMR
ncbi:MAG: YkgJ family cysteine cluster protein [Bacteroidota bacterium]